MTAMAVGCTIAPRSLWLCAEVRTLKGRIQPSPYPVSNSHNRRKYFLVQKAYTMQKEMRTPKRYTVIIAIFILILLLQYFLITGCPLIFVLASFWSKSLINILLIMSIVDALNGNIPKAFFALPIIAYGCYYGVYIKDSIRISLHESELQSTNPVSVMKFDPDIHDLIIGNAYRFVEEYQVPVVYYKSYGDNPEGYFSYRLLDQKSCKALEADIQPDMKLIGVQSKDNRRNGNCILRAQEHPVKEHVTVKYEPDNSWANKGTIGEGGYVLEHHGAFVAKYRTASVKRYSFLALPMIGCGPDGPSWRWKCMAEFWRSGQLLDTRPAGAPDELGHDPVAIMLGIPLRHIEPGDKDSLRKERLLR
jgi:hypothetical protein